MSPLDVTLVTWYRMAFFTGDLEESVNKITLLGDFLPILRAADIHVDYLR